MGNSNLIHYDDWNKFIDEYSSGNKNAEQFLQMAAVEIVEYDGFIKDSNNTPETDKQRDMRMEDKQVYGGDFSRLISYLKDFDVDLQSLTKVEILFKIYNRILSNGEHKNVAVPEKVEVPIEANTSENKNLTTSSKASIVDATEPEVKEPEQTFTEQLSGKQEDESKEEVTVNDIKSNEKLNMELGEKDTPERKSIYYKEAINMADLSALNKMEQTAQGAQSAKPEVKDAFHDAAVNTIKDSQDARIQFTRTNLVKNIISNAEALALRIPEGAKGVIALDNAAERKVKALKKSFAEQTGLQWDKPEEVNWSNKVHEDDLEKMNAIRDLISTIDADPTAEFEIFAPKPNFSVKGVEFTNGSKYPVALLTDLLMKESIGFVVGTNGIVNGEAVRGKQDGTSFELVVRKHVQKNKKDANVTATQAQTGTVTYKREIRVSGKNNMKDNVVYVYNTDRKVGKEGMKYVPVTAAVTLSNGKVVPATFRVQTGDYKQVEKDGKTVSVPVYKTVSIKLRTLVYVTEQTPSPAFANVDATELAMYGKGISAKSGGNKEKEQISTADINSIDKYLSNAGITKVLAAAATGKFEDTTAIADIVAAAKAAGQNAELQATAEASKAVEEDETV